MNRSKLFTSLISILSISILLTGCFYPRGILKKKSDKTESTTTQETTTAQVTTEQPTTTVITAPVYKIGDTLKTQSYYITVKGTRRGKSSTSGYEYIYVDIEIENISNSSKKLFPTYLFRMVDKEGREMNTKSTDEVRGKLNIDLAPGRKVRGEYVAEVPKGIKGLDLLIEPNYFSKGQAAISLD